MWYHRDPYGRRRDPYYDRSYRLIAYLIPLLHEAQRHLTVARTPVTLALLAVQVALHYRGALLPGLELLPNFALRDVCILPARWWELRRLALAPLLHVDDVHLYYNMMSAISKGAALEPVLGPERFGCLVVGLGLAAGVIHVALAFALRALSPAVFGDELYTCAVGFSAVLFALKVVSTWNARGTGEVVFGIHLPMRWLCWGELLWIQLISPNVSFVGHLAGILAGILYIAPPRALRVEVARLRRQARRAWSAVAWAFSAPPPMPRARQPAPAPPPGMPTAEELRALHVARFTRTQRPRGASPLPRRR